MGNVELESLYANGAIAFMNHFKDVMFGIRRDGTINRISKKDLLNVIEFVQEFDKKTMLEFLFENKFIIAINKEGKPIRRYIENGKIIKEES